jgi:hypothetical protein
MTVQRKSEHQEFVDEFATSSTAIHLIEKAMKRLAKFYSPKAVAAEKAKVKEAALKKAGLALLAKQQLKSAEELKEETIQEDKIKQMFSSIDSFVQVKKEGFLLKVDRSEVSVDPVDVPDTPKTYEKKESGGVVALMNQFKTDLKLEMTEAEIEEKHAADDYTRLMNDAQMSRASDVEGLNKKQSAKARLDQDIVDAKGREHILEGEIKNLELYLLQTHLDCDFLLANFETYHNNRIDKEGGLHEALTIVTKGEPPAYREVEAGYDSEHTVADVEANYPPEQEKGEEEEAQ